MSVFLLILSLVLFVGLVVVHEWGHFIMARRGGVEVEEFGIGFPPKIWGKKVKTKKSKFLFTINLLPLGGFVRLKGENNEDKRSGSFGAANLPTKVKIMLAGVGMNALIAFLIFTALAATGMPKLFDNQFTVPKDTKVIQQVKNDDVVRINQVVKDSPAAKAGLQANDRILEISGQKITNIDQVAEATKANAGKTVLITVNREGRTLTLNATLNKQNTGHGYLGTSNSGKTGIELDRSTWSSPIVSLGLMKQFSVLTLQGLGTALNNLFHGHTQKASEQVSGPVGIFYILKQGSELGISFILMIIAIISLTLALINALPIPALDGGRLFVTLLFRVIRQPLTKNREDLIHGTGFVVLMVLFVLITFVDIRRFILT